MKGRDTLDVFDFGVLFQALAQSRKLGTLRVTNGTREKFIFLSEGRVEGIYTPRSRFRIGQILYNHRAVEMEDLEPALREQQTARTHVPLGEDLLRRGLIDENQLAVAVRYQVVEELLEIFYWKDLSYEFFSGPPEKSLGHISRDLTRVGGSHPADDLLLRVTKIIDDIDKFNQVTPSLRDVYELSEDPEEYVERCDDPDEVLEVLDLIDGRRDMREILAEMRMNRFDVMELLYRLRVDGLIRAKNGFELVMLAEAEDFPAAKRARLYERVVELGVEGHDVLLDLARAYEEIEDPDRAASNYLEYAKKSLREGRLDAAEIGASRAIGLFPRSRSLRRLRSTILEQAGRTEDAAEDLRALARLARKQGDHEESEKTLKHALDLLPEDEDLMLLLASTLEALGRRSAAAHACLRLSRRRAETGNLDGAEESLRMAVRIHPDSLRFRNALVEHLVGREMTSLAIVEIGAMVPVILARTEGRNRRARRLLGVVRNRIEKLGGQNSTVMLALADAYFARGGEELGLAVLRSAGEAQLAARRLTDALEAYSRAVDVDPEDTSLREALARIYAELGDKGKALSQLRRVAKQHRKSGKTVEAEQVYEEMLRVDPFSPDALRELAALCAEADRHEDSARRLAQIGHLFRAAGRADLAVEYYDRACRLDADNPENLKALADGLAEVLNMERSVSSYVRLLSLLREKGRHAAAIDTGLRILDLDRKRDDVRDLIRDSLRSLETQIE